MGRRIATTCLLDKLIGKTVVSLSRVVLENEQANYSAVMDDTLVFTVSNCSRFELLTGHSSVLFKEVPRGANFFTDWELEEGDRLLSQEGLFDAPLALPFTVDSITEFWVGEEKKRFLAGAILWNANREAVLSIYTETDEIELISMARIKSLIDEMPFIYGSVESLWYNQILEQ